MARKTKHKNWQEQQGRKNAPSAPDPMGWSTRSSYSWLIYAGLAITIVAASIIFLMFGNTLVERIAPILNLSPPTAERVERQDLGTTSGPAAAMSQPPHEVGRRQGLTLSDLGLNNPEAGNANKPLQAPTDTHRTSNQQPPPNNTPPAETATSTEGLGASEALQAPGSRPPATQRQPSETPGTDQLTATHSETTAAPTIKRPPDRGQGSTRAAETSEPNIVTSTEENTAPAASPSTSPAVPASASPAETTRQPDAGSQFETSDDTAMARLEPPTTRQLARSMPQSSLGSPEQLSPARPQQATNTRREITILLAEGDSAYVIGELELARISYRSAFEKGNAEAARRLGETFDPVQLKRDGWPQTFASPSEAILWYEDASRLGDANADARLEDLLLWLSRSAASGNVEAQRVLDIWRERQG